MTQETTEKSISERLAEILPQLSKDQMRFVAAMQECTTKRDAADALGLTPDTVYHWPKLVDEAIQLCALEPLQAAREERNRLVLKAVMVKATGLDSSDERVRQSVATEFIEWALGKAMQRQEHTGRGGGPIETESHELNRALSTLADAVGEIIPSPSTDAEGVVDATE